MNGGAMDGGATTGGGTTGGGTTGGAMNGDDAAGGMDAAGRAGGAAAMRAATIVTCGRPPVPARLPVPRPGPGQVRVAVTAAPIVPLDLLCASGTSYFGTPATPYVPGVQGVGTAPDGTAVWFPTVAGMRPGDGSIAEYCVVPAADVVALPAGADHALMAALGLSAVAAWAALIWRGELAPGERVLVLGASGAVGQVAVQAARLAGAGRVIAAARSTAGLDLAMRLGADAVVPLHDSDDVASLATRLAAACGGPVDLVLDPLCGVPSAAALRTLGNHGRMVNLGSAAAETAPYESAILRSRSLRVLGYTNNELTAAQRAAAVTAIAEHAAAGRLTIDHETVPLSAAPDAWRRQSDGSATRRLVVLPADPDDR